MYEWGHSYDIVSGVDHPGSNSVGLLTMTAHCNIRGINVVLQVPHDSPNPMK
jgi:hypothetical protein